MKSEQDSRSLDAFERLFSPDDLDARRGMYLFQPANEQQRYADGGLRKESVDETVGVMAKGIAQFSRVGLRRALAWRPDLSLFGICPH